MHSHLENVHNFSQKGKDSVVYSSYSTSQTKDQRYSNSGFYIKTFNPSLFMCCNPRQVKEANGSERNVPE